MATRPALRDGRHVWRIVLFSWLALSCGGGGGVSNNPGRAVTGCFDCTEREYCLIVSGTADRNYCASASCGVGCDCIVDDGRSRLEVCEHYSCQQGSAILYCFE